MKEKIIFNWSGGKDSALCLYNLKQSQQYEIQCLLTSVSKQYQRISMHGVRADLLDKQAWNIGLPLIRMEVPDMPSMEAYESAMRKTLTDLKSKGAIGSVFGDIFLEDLRAYREKKLAELGLNGIFPLWKIPTSQLIRQFIDLGFKAVITCVNDLYLDKSFAGRLIDDDFVVNLPSNVDPCGENGEFHSFVFDGPIFKQPVSFSKGEIVYRKYESSAQNDSAQKEKKASPFNNGFWYCDLLLN